jgi:hypothetical protein
MADVALRDVYKATTGTVYGAICKHVKYKENKAEISFDTDGSDIIQKGELRGFEVLENNKWVSPTSLYMGLNNAFLQTTSYVNELQRTASFNNKPLVITSCSYPRDKMFRYEGSTTLNRNAYFSTVLYMTKQQGNESPSIAGCFFTQWAMPSEITDDTPKNTATQSIYATDSATISLLQKNKVINK